MEAHELHIQLDPAKRASDDIYEQLRALITSGALKPGDRLPSERAMMAELQRSRPTIREALKRLEQGGYVLHTGCLRRGGAGAEPPRRRGAAEGHDPAQPGVPLGAE